MRASIARYRVFQVATTILVVVVAASAVHGLLNVQDSIDQSVRLFVGAGAGASDADTPLYRGGADVIGLSIATLAASVLALLLIWKAPERADARALALFLACVFVPDDVIRVAASLFGISISEEALASLGWVPLWFALAAFFRFSVLFPRPLSDADIENDWKRRHEARQRMVARLRRSVPRRRSETEADAAPIAPPDDSEAATPKSSRLRVRLNLLRAGLPWMFAGVLSVVTIVLATRGGIGPWFALVFAMMIVGVLLFGIQYLRLGYRASDESDRKQILWILNGFYAAAWLALLIFLVSPLYERFAARSLLGGYGWFAIAQILLPLPLLVIVASLYVGIFYDGALDPGRVIRKTTVYGFVGLAEIFLFGAIEELAASTMVERLVGDATHKAAFLAGGVVALGFHPIKHWVEARLDGWLPNSEHRRPAREHSPSLT